MTKNSNNQNSDGVSVDLNIRYWNLVYREMTGEYPASPAL
jgi:hypothetical protein